MSDATTQPTVTVDGVTVTKSYETDEFPVPAVAFRLESERSDAAEIHLRDRVPDGIPSNDLGFHPDYDSDHWSIQDGAAVFEYRLEAGASHRTVYGIRTTSHDPEAFMQDPGLDVDGLGDPEPDPTAGDDPTDADDPTDTDDPEPAIEPATADGSDGRATSDAGTDEEMSGPADGDMDPARPTDSPEAPPETATATAAATDSGVEPGTGATTAGDEASGTALPDGGVGAALAAEIREGSLSEADREVLRDELERKRRGGEVRLTHLQSRISDLEAYTDALEGFIDEHGSARQLIEDMTSRLDTIETELDALDDRTSENEVAIAALVERAERSEGNIEALDKGLASVQGDLTETHESIDGLREDIAAVDDWRARVAAAFGEDSDAEIDTS